MEAEIINVLSFRYRSHTRSSTRMWEDLLMQPCVIIANLQNLVEIRLEGDTRHANA